MDVQFLQHHLLKNLFSTELVLLLQLFEKSVGHICVWTYFWILYSAPLSYMCVPLQMSASWLLETWNRVASLEIMSWCRMGHFLHCWHAPTTGWCFSWWRSTSSYTVVVTLRLGLWLAVLSGSVEQVHTRVFVRTGTGSSRDMFLRTGHCAVHDCTVFFFKMILAALVLLSFNI